MTPAPQSRKMHSVFFTIFFSLLLALVIELTLLIGTIIVGQVPSQLDDNAEEILREQVENRSGYLQNFLISSQELTSLSTYINTQTEALLADGRISLDTLDSGSAASEPLLRAISSELVFEMRAKKLSGIYVIFCSRDLDDCVDGTRFPGIYVRDLDPDGPYSDRNDDLSLEFAPATLVQSTGLYTASAWQPAFEYQREASDFFYLPYQTARNADTLLSTDDYGHWTRFPFCLPDDPRSVFSYSQPLILSDGTVYGVVGIGLLSDTYLCGKLPPSELQNNGSGSYLLCSTTDDLSADTLTLQIAVCSSPDAAIQAENTLVLQKDASGEGFLTIDGTRYFASEQPLALYSRNAPFSGEHWLLIGLVPVKQLYSFSGSVRQMLVIIIVLTLLAGVFASFIVSRRLAQPITRLSKQVSASQNQRYQVPTLSPTGIRELDQFSAAFTQRSQEILDTSVKFQRIMELASVEIGGFEKRPDVDTVYVTDNFFSLLALPDVPLDSLDKDWFDAILNGWKQMHERVARAYGGDVYALPAAGGTVRYILLRSGEECGTQVGLVEDVTTSMQERRRIEHERDYDVLTGLYNRFSFMRKVQEMFAHPDKMRHAALLMTDLDDLKRINDTYGHDCGDRYIRLTGQCLAENIPANAVCSRLSGDEFVVLLHGYESRDALRADLTHLQEAMSTYTAVLPSGDTMHIAISGGVAWYPDDSRDFATLKRYADFALYQVKRQRKGEIREFDIGAYNREAYCAQLRQEFTTLLENDSVFYHFQPLFSARDGHVVAYEALMRVNMPLLRSPETIMKLAHEENRLYDIEHLTLFKGTQTFEHLVSCGKLSPDAKLFINSIANVSLTDADFADFRRQFAPMLKKMVIEITEEEETTPEVLAIKRRQLGETAVFALDDYGSGYSNSNNLLLLAPHYIKVDIAIIRGIDSNIDKQQVVTDVVTYAHARQMQVVAEGIENEAELRTVLRLGVDLLQGYFLARPAAIPDPIAPAALKILKDAHFA